MDKQAELQAKLRELRRNFLDQLPQRMLAIERDWQVLTQKEWTSALLAQLHRQVHSLTGTAGTFGFMELSDAARSLEQKLKALVQRGSAPLEGERIELDAAFRALRQQCPEPVFDRPAVSSGQAAVSGRGQASAHHLVVLFSADPELQQALAAQLGYFGYALETVPTASALAQRMSGAPPAALLVDARFDQGRLVDREAIGALRETQESRIPIIMLAETGQLAERVDAVRAGGDAYLLKPFDIADLVDQLDHLIGSGDPDPYRVLVVEDDPDLAARYSLVLNNGGMRVLTITRALDIMSALIELQPDLVLMDIYMPECSGLELARVIRQQEAYVSLPIVYLSSERDVDKQYEAMSLGGDEFLTKPIEDDRLVRAVRNRAARSRLLHSLVSRDSLTGLLKHTKIKEALEIEFSRARRQGTLLSYVMLDIDHFKAVNDHYGHLAGDRVIRSLAHLLRQRLRKSDLIGRYGGEEFAVIMPDTSLAQAAQVMDEVRAAFSRLRHQWMKQQIRCSFSAGVACFPDHESAEGVAAAADEALYLAKGSGRDRVVSDTAEGQRRMPR